MKRTLILLMTGAMLATSPAFAGQDEIAYGVAGVIAYDKTCQKVDPVMLQGALAMKQTVPAEMYSAAAMNLFEAFVRMGKPAWCAKVKDIING